MILKRLYNILPNNSIVLYSVCTFNPLESEYIVSKALEMGYEVEELPTISLNYERGIVEWRGYRFPYEVKRTIRIYPHLNSGYGNLGYLYIALLRRR